MPKQIQKNNFLFKFDRIALVIGFVVDTITLVSIILAIKISEISIKLPAYISPGLAFSIWLLAIYTYFGLLHRFWENNEEFSSNSFSYFVFRRLIFGFQKPIMLFPGFILIILLFWIALAVDDNGTTAGVLGVFLFVAFMMSAFVMAMAAGETDDEIVTEEHKSKVDESWKFLDERIAQKLTRHQWLTIFDLNEIAKLWGIPTSAMNHA